MNAKFHNNLRFYTLSVNESPELAEQAALEFEEKFNKLSKWDQVYISGLLDSSSFEEAMKYISECSA